MGLDMYLEAEEYIGGQYDYSEVEGEAVITIQGNKKNIDFKKVNSITYPAAYWRKANQIHKWFVNNVQDGIDECQRSYVDISQLRDLIDTCNIVIQNHEKAEALLPTGSGFFFGSTEYDEFYFQDLHETVKQLKQAIEDYPHCSFYYSASW